MENFNFEELLNGFYKMCTGKYYKSSENSSSNEENASIENEEQCYGQYTTKNGYGCWDMPGGFQGLNPLLFTIIGDILADIMAGALPFNVQNAFGNWLQLIGQIILTCNAQQTYFQTGPGRYYNPSNINDQNPFCPSASGSGNTQENTQSSNNSAPKSDTLNSTDSSENNISDYKCIIEQQKKKIDCMMEMISEMQEEIRKLKENNKNLSNK